MLHSCIQRSRQVAYVSIRQHTSAYVSIRQYTSAYVSISQHTSAYVSIRQHTSAYVSIRQHTSAYSSIRQHTSAYVSIRVCQQGTVTGTISFSCQVDTSRGMEMTIQLRSAHPSADHHESGQREGRAPNPGALSFLPLHTRGCCEFYSSKDQWSEYR
jgi:hypothetical protein